MPYRDDSNRLALLFDAAQNGDTEILEALLRSNVAVNAASPAGTTALEIAANADHVDAVNHLIQHGATVREKDILQFPDVILKTIEFHELSTYRDVLDGNAFLFLQAVSRGRPALADAIYQGLLDVRQTAKNGLLLGEALYHAIHSNDVDTVRWSLSLGANVHAVDRFGSYPLSVAAARGNTEISLLLLENGAAIDQASVKGHHYTPLMDAIRNGFAATALALVDKGADVDVAGSDHATPISLAKKRNLQMVIDAIQAQDYAR